MLEVITKSEAMSRGLERYFTGIPCKRGHLSERAVSHGHCLECWKAYPRRVPRAALLAKERGELTYVGSKCKRGHELRYVSGGNCVECVKENQKSQMSIPEKRESKTRLERARYHSDAEFRAKRIAYKKSQKAERARCRPDWISESHKAEMEGAYLYTSLMPSPDGHRLHVDHVAPLLAKKTCGLDVPWNMAVSSARENWSKNNRVDHSELTDQTRMFPLDVSGSKAELKEWVEVFSCT